LGHPLLAWAAWHGAADCIRFLLAAGASACQPGTAEHLPHDITSAEGHTPLQVAVMGGHPHAITVLLGAADLQINTQDTLGNTALHTAAASGHRDLQTALLAGSPDVTVLNRAGLTPITVARITEALDEAKHGGEVPWQDATRSGSVGLSIYFKWGPHAG
jgi:ankyrin repeat protein